MSRRLITAIASSVIVSVGLIVGYLASAGAASAMPAPAPDGGGVLPGAPPAPTITVVHHSSSVWAFVIVALLAVVATLAIVQAVGWIRRSRRRLQPA